MSNPEIYRYDLGSDSDSNLLGGGGVKCGFCNYRTVNHYIIASSQEEADELMEEDMEGREADKKGFCAQCLIDEVINARRDGGEPSEGGQPNMQLVQVGDN